MSSFPVRPAKYPAAKANKTDFEIMAGRRAGTGIPKNIEFTKGESIATKRPNFIPYLYAPTRVKKYIGNNVGPPRCTR